MSRAGIALALWCTAAFPLLLFTNVLKYSSLVVKLTITNNYGV